MTIRELASQLRARIRTRRHLGKLHVLAANMAEAAADDEVIQTVCYCFGETNLDTIPSMIGKSSDVEEFLRLMKQSRVQA